MRKPFIESLPPSEISQPWDVRILYFVDNSVSFVPDHIFMSFCVISWRNSIVRNITLNLHGGYKTVFHFYLNFISLNIREICKSLWDIWSSSLSFFKFIFNIWNIFSLGHLPFLLIYRDYLCILNSIILSVICLAKLSSNLWLTLLHIFFNEQKFLIFM
jgi:hypothetical protein